MVRHLSSAREQRACRVHLWRLHAREAERIGNSNGLLAPPPPAAPAPAAPRLVRATRRAAAACRSGSQPGGARRRALWLVLDRRLRMG
jgi:hypothetical protein